MNDLATDPECLVGKMDWDGIGVRGADEILDPFERYEDEAAAFAFPASSRAVMAT